MRVDMHDALTDLVAAAEAGDEVIIARGGMPAVRLVPVLEPPVLAGQIALGDDAAAPLPGFDL